VIDTCDPSINLDNLAWEVVEEEDVWRQAVSSVTNFQGTM
jgi:hypothetical protein